MSFHFWNFYKLRAVSWCRFSSENSLYGGQGSLRKCHSKMIDTFVSLVSRLFLKYLSTKNLKNKVLPDASWLQNSILTVAGNTLLNQNTSLALNYTFLKDSWVTSVCLPSPECPVAPDTSGTHTQRLSHCLQWTKGGLVALPCRRPEDTEDTIGGTVWLSNLPKIRVSEW